MDIMFSTFREVISVLFLKVLVSRLHQWSTSGKYFPAFNLPTGNIDVQMIEKKKHIHSFPIMGVVLVFALFLPLL